MKSNIKGKIIALIAILLLSVSASAQCYLQSSPSEMSLSKTTGVARVDEIINNEQALLELIFQVDIDMYVGGEQNNQPNAYFSPKCGSYSCDGHIAIGINLLVDLSGKSYGSERLKAIMAHEYAHALQNKYQWAGRGRNKELHADYLAGYYIGIKGLVSEDLLIAFSNEFYSRGDYNFFDPNTHGTPNERACAFQQGYFLAVLGNAGMTTAYNKAVKYVNTHYECQEKQVSSFKEYMGTGSGSSEADAIVGAIVVVAMIGLISNDIYYKPTYYFPYNKKEDLYHFNSGRGWDIGLRKSWTHADLEYGVIRTVNDQYELQKDLSNNESLVFITTQNLWNFKMNYLHDLNFRTYPSGLMPYVGAGFHLGFNTEINISAGLEYRIIDRLTADVRGTVGHRSSLIQAGLIFKYQKDYLWNK